MSFMQRLWMRLTARFVPQFHHALRQADGSIDKMSEQLTLYRMMVMQDNVQRQSRQQELREAMSMAGAGPWGAPENGDRAVTESALTKPLKESIADLELGLEDRGWRRQVAWSEMEFSRWGIQQIILICRLFRIKNPLIQRGILVSSYYVFGRGVQVTSEDKAANEVLTAFFQDPRNKEAIGPQALIEAEGTLYTDGNIFWAFFTAVDDGTVLIRTIDAVEIEEIITDPNDSSVPRFYKRRWNQADFSEETGVTTLTMKTAWYVALGYDTGVSQIGRDPVAKDSAGQYVRIYHRRDGGLPKWHFGCPRAYAAIDWARAYKARLEDYATIVRQMSRFAFDVETKGGAPAIAALKNTLATTLGNGGMDWETNPPPTAGAGFIHGPGTKLGAFEGAGKTPPPEEGRRLAHMVYMVFGLPECYDDQTEVLTDHGFVLHSEWKPGMKVACFNPDSGLIEWHDPGEVRVFPYTGEMVHFESQQVDINVTPNHRMWCAPVVGWNAQNPTVDRSWRIELAEAVEQSHRVNGWRFSTKINLGSIAHEEKGNTPIGERRMTDWARFLGYWISEGCATASVCKSGEFRKDGTPIMRTFRRIMLAQKTPEILQNMRDCLNDLELHFGEVKANAGVTDLVIHNKTLWEWLRENCGTGSHSKQIPPWMLLASGEIRQALYEALMEGDGRPSGGSMVYSTVSSVLADQMQFLACSLGYGASVTAKHSEYNGKPHVLFNVWIRSRITDETVVKPQHIQREWYEGSVYCFSVPTGIYVTRRKGKIAIQGNTFFSDVSVGTLATATSLDRPTELKFLTHQEMWMEDFKVIAQYVLAMSAGSARGRLREARAKNPAPQPADVKVVFPPILEGDLAGEITSVVQSMTLGTGDPRAGIDQRTGIMLLLQKLGVEDVEVVLNAMFPEATYEPDRTLEPEEPEPEPVIPTAKESTVLRAVAELKSAMKRLQEHNGVPR